MAPEPAPSSSPLAADLDQRSSAAQMRSGRRQPAPLQGGELERTLRRPAQSRPHRLDRRQRVELTQLELVQQEIIRVLRLDVVAKKHHLWKVLEIERHDRVSVARDRRGQNVPIIGVGQRQASISAS